MSPQPLLDRFVPTQVLLVLVILIWGRPTAFSPCYAQRPTEVGKGTLERLQQSTDDDGINRLAVFSTLVADGESYWCREIVAVQQSPDAAFESGNAKRTSRFIPGLALLERRTDRSSPLLTC